MTQPQRFKRLAVHCLLLVAIAAGNARAHAEDSPCTDAVVLVDLNQADAEQLQRLPRIGPARAQAILRARAKMGGFKRVSQLLRVKGIGRATLRLLRPHVTVASRSGPNSPGTDH